MKADKLDLTQTLLKNEVALEGVKNNARGNIDTLRREIAELNNALAEKRASMDRGRMGFDHAQALIHSRVSSDNVADDKAIATIVAYTDLVKDCADIQDQISAKIAELFEKANELDEAGVSSIRPALH